MLASTIRKVTFIGDGETMSFPFTFPLAKAEDMRVSIYDTATGETTVITKDYYVDMQGKVVLYPGYEEGQEPEESERPGTLQKGKTITLYRETERDQLTDLGDKYPLPDIEAMADKLTMIVQEDTEAIQRAVKVPIGSPGTPEALLKTIYDARDRAETAATGAKQSENGATNAYNGAKQSVTVAIAAKEAAEASRQEAANEAAKSQASANLAKTAEASAASTLEQAKAVQANAQELDTRITAANECVSELTTRTETAAQNAAASESAARESAVLAESSLRAARQSSASAASAAAEAANSASSAREAANRAAVVHANAQDLDTKITAANERFSDLTTRTETAAQNAQLAESGANAAKASAERAKSDAEQALHQAQDAATVAGGYADSARSSEQNTASSAAAAASAVQNAENAAKEAKKAEGGAVSAFSHTIQCKQDAEKAKEEAQSAAQEAKEAAEKAASSGAKQDCRLTMPNGWRMYVQEEEGKPALYVEDKIGNAYSIGEFVLKKRASYALLSNYEVYPVAWLVNHPEYVREKLVDLDGNPLYIWKTFSAEEDVQKIIALSKQLTFDNEWDVTISENGVVSMNLDALRPVDKSEGDKRSPKYDTAAGEWLIPKDNTYGQLGIGYGQPYVYDGTTGHRTILEPQFERVNGEAWSKSLVPPADAASGLIEGGEYTYTNEPVYPPDFIRAKDPASVYPDAKPFDIYPQFPADYAYTRDIQRVMLTKGHAKQKYMTKEIPSKEEFFYRFESSWIGYPKEGYNLKGLEGTPYWRAVLMKTAGAWNPYDFMKIISAAPNQDGYYKLSEIDNMLPFLSKDIADIQQGQNFTVYLLKDGSVWTAGANTRGQLGAGAMAEKERLGIWAAPIDIRDFSSIAVCQETWIALGNNGILYGCGANTFGQLGQGDTMDRYVLTPLADYVERAILTAGTLIIRKTTGEVYGAGYNYDDRMHLERCENIHSFTQLTEV